MNSFSTVFAVAPTQLEQTIATLYNYTTNFIGFHSGEGGLLDPLFRMLGEGGTSSSYLGNHIDESATWEKIRQHENHMR